MPLARCTLLHLPGLPTLTAAGTLPAAAFALCLDLVQTTPYSGGRWMVVRWNVVLYIALVDGGAYLLARFDDGSLVAFCRPRQLGTDSLPHACSLPP